MTAQPLEPRVSRLEGAFEQIVERLGDTNVRLERLEYKVDANYHALDAKMEQRFVGIDQKFSAMDQKIDSRFHFLIGTYLTTTIALAGIFFAALFPLYRHIAQ